jgi:hypothetical protein
MSFLKASKGRLSIQAHIHILEKKTGRCNGEGKSAKGAMRICRQLKVCWRRIGNMPRCSGGERHVRGDRIRFGMSSEVVHISVSQSTWSYAQCTSASPHVCSDFSPVITPSSSRTLLLSPSLTLILLLNAHGLAARLGGVTDEVTGSCYIVSRHPQHPTPPFYPESTYPW